MASHYTELFGAPVSYTCGATMHLQYLQSADCSFSQQLPATKVYTSPWAFEYLDLETATAGARDSLLNL